MRSSAFALVAALSRPSDGSPPTSRTSSDGEGGGALARARSLIPPDATATEGGEFEHHEFWEENGALLREAWAELGAATDGACAAPHGANASIASAAALGGAVGTGPFDPRLAAAVSAAWEFPSIGTEDAVRTLWEPAIHDAPDLGVYRAGLLTEDGVRLVRQGLDCATSSGVPTRRPNGMNRYGIIVDGGVDGACSFPPLEDFVRELTDRYVRPIGRALFPADVGEGDDSERYAFTIRYEECGDEKLNEHRDASVVTLNVNLNLPDEGYGGSKLYFVDPADRSKRHEMEFAPGMAIIHKGALRHAALPINEGMRQNLVIWLFGDRGEVRIAPYAPHEQLTLVERWRATKENFLPWF